MRRTRQHVVIPLLVAAMASCGGDEGPSNSPLSGGNLNGAGVQVTTGEASYAAGSPVGLTIHNQESDPLAYNACTRELEFWDGNNWVPGPASLRLCTKRVWYVQPGEASQDTTDLDLGLVPGDYRIVISFTRDQGVEAEAIRAVTNAFTLNP
jgi:hypothetical protein